MQQNGNKKTAFVLAGGGSLGAVQVGMLKVLASQNIVPDFVVGASVGAINSAIYAAEPSEEGVARLESMWLKLHRADVFPLSAVSSILGLFGKRNHLVDPAPLRSLIESALPYQWLEEAKIPCHIVATDVLKGTETVLSSGRVALASLGNAAIPGVFPTVLISGRYLMDGGVANNTPISTAFGLGAKRVIVLPTGMSCALEAPPHGAIAVALHALNLLIMRQLLSDIEDFSPRCELIVVPPDSGLKRTGWKAGVRHQHCCNMITNRQWYTLVRHLFLPAYPRVGARNPKSVKANGSERNKFSVFATHPGVAYLLLVRSLNTISVT